MAPESEIVFYAVEITARWTQRGRDFWGRRRRRPPEYGNFALPDDLTGFFRSIYRSGVRVHVNPWEESSGDREYNSSYAAQIDRFVWNHPDFLVLNAAGNRGRPSSHNNEEIAYGSISSPGNR